MSRPPVAIAGWTPPPALRGPPRDTKGAMIHDGSWWVFTMAGVPSLFRKSVLNWKNQYTGKSYRVGDDWVPLGPVAAVHINDCSIIHNLRAEVASNLKGIT